MTEAAKMTTETLYYEDPRLARTVARIAGIESSESGRTIILDRTIFFPEGGGQPSDLGTLGGFQLLAVKESGGRIIHLLDGGSSLAVGDEVELVLDTARRRDHTLQHSGQHLLSAVLEHEMDIHTIGFHLGLNYSTIDVNGMLLEKKMIDRVEASVNAWIGEDRPIRTHICPPEDLASFKLRRKLPEGKEVIRVVEMDGYDWVACCGTHAPSTGALRVFKILSCEKYKGGTRICFVAGERAVAALSSHFEIAKKAASLCGGSMEALPDRITALLQRAEKAESEKNALVRERARLEVERMIADGAGIKLPEDRELLAFSFTDRDAAAALEQVKTAVNHGRIAMAASLPEKTVLLMAPSEAEHGGKAAGAVFAGLTVFLKAKMLEAGGVGGGRAGNFRAVFASEEAATDFMSSVMDFLC
ncbi:MAG: hypothetical protein LLF89_10815, partial [Spirochaetaceae bacterium]|nr:hypothetical protein [Spirochaetaceae bacterium]